MGEKILEMRGITKYIFDAYGKAIKNSTVRILSDVNFDLERGEVHILVGENGAGKSTLMKVLGGVIPQDEGAITLEGKDYVVHNTREARDAGIAFIHQELNLCINLDIAHNIFLGREPVKHGFVDEKEMYRQSKRMLEEFGFEDMDPHTLISDLSTAKQQVVEIVKAMSYSSRIVIMDEPTASLTQKEIDHLFALIRRLRADGVSIIYISHRFDELKEIGDRLTVLRDGQSIATMSMEDFDYDKVVQLMVGRSIGKMFDCKHTPTDEELLRVEGLKISPRTKPVDLCVRRGEVVGLGGLVGAGRTELCKSIFGARKYYGGKIQFKGKEYKHPTPIESIRNGLVYLSEDRKLEGLVIEKDVGENITLASLRTLFPSYFINFKKERKIAEDCIREQGIICRGTQQRVNTLSGGNQQKVLFAKCMTAKPDLLILDEPTRGIDVNAKAEIYSIIDRIAMEGVGVLMISSELPELIGMSDRIYVMGNGAVNSEIREKSEMTQEKILRSTLGNKGE